MLMRALGIEPSVVASEVTVTMGTKSAGQTPAIPFPAAGAVAAIAAPIVFCICLQDSRGGKLEEMSFSEMRWRRLALVRDRDALDRCIAGLDELLCLRGRRVVEIVPYDVALELWRDSERVRLVRRRFDGAA